VRLFGSKVSVNFECLFILKIVLYQLHYGSNVKNFMLWLMFEDFEGRHLNFRLKKFREINFRGLLVKIYIRKFGEWLVNWMLWKFWLKVFEN